MTHPGQFQWWNFVKDGKIIQILGSSTSKNCCFSSKRLQNHAKPLLVATDGFETHHLRCSLVWEWGIVPMVWYGGFLSHVGTPTAGWFITEKTIYKWMIWGYSYFMKPPYIYNIYTYIIYIYTLIYRKSGRWSSKPSTVCSARLKSPLHKNPVKCTTNWLVVWNMLYFSIYWEFHNPNWLMFSRGVETTNQTREAWLIEDGLGWPSSIRRHFRRKPYCKYPLVMSK